MDLVYASPALLAPGSVVPPGNYGKNVFAHRPGFTDGWVLARELIFENVRLRFAAHRPSRLACGFLFTSTSAALALKGHLERTMLAPRLYSVELIDPTLPCCYADYDALQKIEAENFTGSALQAALGYWTGATDDMAPWTNRAHEFLTLSPFRVVRAITAENEFAFHCPTLTTAEVMPGPSSPV